MGGSHEFRSVFHDAHSGRRAEVTPPPASVRHPYPGWANSGCRVTGRNGGGFVVEAPANPSTFDQREVARIADAYPMTAMNAFARPDGAYLIGDTACYHADGRIAGFESKIAYSIRHKLMIGRSGSPGPNIGRNLQAHLDGARDQASALAGIRDLLRDLRADADDLREAEARCDARARSRGLPEEAFVPPRPPGIRLLLAWWDEELGEGRCAGIASKDDFLGQGIAAYAIRPLRTIFAPALPADVWPGHSFEPLVDVDALGRMQRRRPAEDGKYIVGGAFEIMRVSAAGVEGFTALEWPDDAIGKPIDPTSPDREPGVAEDAG